MALKYLDWGCAEIAKTLLATSLLERPTYQILYGMVNGQSKEEISEKSGLSMSRTLAALSVWAYTLECIHRPGCKPNVINHGEGIDVDAKIKAKYYYTTVPRISYPIDEPYYKAQEVLNDEFEKDTLESLGLVGHPKANKLFSMALEEYWHDASFMDVWNKMQELAELLP